MMRHGVNSNRPTALDMMPLELHPWYRHHLQRLGGGACQAAGRDAWRIAIETEPTDVFKQQGIELCDEINWPTRCKWARN